MQLRFPLKNLGLIWETITSRESIIMQDIRKNTPLGRAFRVAIGDLRKTTFRHIRACMIIPLTLKEQAIGMLVLLSSEKQAFTPHHATLALAIANRQPLRLRTRGSMNRHRNWPPLRSASAWHANCMTRSPRRSTVLPSVPVPARTLLDRDLTQVDNHWTMCSRWPRRGLPRCAP